MDNDSSRAQKRKNEREVYELIAGGPQTATGIAAKCRN
jgi:hypothetical protein